MQFVLLSILSLLAYSQTLIAQDHNVVQKIASSEPFLERPKAEPELPPETISENNGDAQTVDKEGNLDGKSSRDPSSSDKLAFPVRAPVDTKSESKSETYSLTCIDGNFSPAQNDLRPPVVISLKKQVNAPDDPLPPAISTGFRWGPAIRQSLMFLGFQHGYGLTQPKTRRALKGKFFKDYFSSVKSLRGWDDGGKFFTNYIAHPMQGAFTGFIQIQNDPKGMKQRFGPSKEYWQSRMKALAWSAAWSTQWEIGPISQASIGNIGLYDKQAYVDLVITPTVGTALLITEDAVDRYIVESIERRTRNFYFTIFSRMLLNPTRTVANLFRFKEPWYRDRPRR